MTNPITLFDLLGVGNASDAAALWPADLASFAQPPIDDRVVLLAQLQASLAFANVRAGVDGAALGGQISLSADLHLLEGTTIAPIPTLFLNTLPGFGIKLLPTDPSAPARCFFARDSRGVEVVLESLPVTLVLPEGLLEPGTWTTPPVSPSYDATALDAFESTLKNSPDGSELSFKVRIHLTPEGDLLFEPNVPLSVTDGHLLGVQAHAIYDMSIIPALRRRDTLEWARHGLKAFGADGGFAFRSIDLNDLKRYINGPVNITMLEVVCEDVVLPVPAPLKFPIPSHGTFGVRSTAKTGDVFALNLQPILIHLESKNRLTVSIGRLFFETGDPPKVELEAALLWETESRNTLGIEISVDDDFTVRAGLIVDDNTPLDLFTIAGFTISLQGAKLGIGIGRLVDGEPFKNSYEVLFDLVGQSSGGSDDDKKFQLKSLDGDDGPMVLRDVGWSFGHFHLPEMKSPPGFQMIFGGKLHLVIEEMGFIEEADGTQYFSFTGGVELAMCKGDEPTQGLRFRRLRFPTPRRGGPPFKIDGITLNLQFGEKVKIHGFGYIRESATVDWLIKEWGLGVGLEFPLGTKTFSLAAAFIKGSRTPVADPSKRLGYFLASFKLGYLTTGELDLFDLRMVFAQNLTPKIAPPSGGDDRMPLFNWYKQNHDALIMPEDRAMTMWGVKENAISAGVGTAFSFKSCGKWFRIDLFVFVAYTEEETGILAVGELYLSKNPKPVAWVAIEYEFRKQKFGVLIGLDLKLSDLFDNSPSWMGGPSLTGTIYLGNKPWTFEMGKLADQRSWLAIRAHYAVPIEIDFVLACCMQIVEGGPKGFGVIFTFSGNADYKIGEFRVYATFGLIIGCWKSGSDSSGILFWIGMGFSIKLFGVFRFGADISLRITYLGKHPWFTTLSAHIAIRTPRFLPKVTFSFDKTWSEQLPFQQKTIRLQLGFADGLSGFDGSSWRLATTPLLDDSLQVIDSSRILSFEELTRATESTSVPDASDIPILPTTATIALKFAQAISNDMAVGPDVGNAGVQRVQELEVRYALKSLGVKRAARYGADQGVWKDFLAESTTALDGSGQSSVTFAPSLSIRWQLDSRSDGKLNPDCLLLNGSSPYTFAIAGPQDDEEVLRNDRGFPCCTAKGEGEKPSHNLSFFTAPGIRLPLAQQFSNQGAWWHWSEQPLAVSAVRPGEGTPISLPPGGAGIQRASFAQVELPSVQGEAILGSVDFPDPVVQVLVHLKWSTVQVAGDSPARITARLFLDVFSGLDLANQVSIDLTGSASGEQTYTVNASATTPITRFAMRLDLGPGGVGVPPPLPERSSFTLPQLSTLQVANMAYVTAEDAAYNKAAIVRCRNSGGTTGGAGKLAFLPNQLYEITLRGETRMSSDSQGTRAVEKGQKSYFFTKDLPGLNAVENVGDELRPMVENVYPANVKSPLYRDELVAIAFSELMSTILPVQASLPSDPDEKTQKMDLALNIDRIASNNGLRRITVASNDWLDAHRTAPRDPAPEMVLLAEAPRSVAVARQSASLDPAALRYERLLASSPRCQVNPLHASQVLVHTGVDATGNDGSWEGQTTYRVTVRRSAGPYVRRDAFDDIDAAALQVPSWSISTAGALVAPAVPGRQLALLGDAGWMHLRVQSRIDSGTAAAGIAVGVSGNDAIVAMVTAQGADRLLSIERHHNNTVVQAPVATLSASTGEITLTVTAFGDRIRAECGAAVVEIDRGAVREGFVAMVSDGGAEFRSLNVDPLDMFAFDFATSRFKTFNEHIASYSGPVPPFDPAELGAAPSTTLPNWLAAHQAEVIVAMRPDADPQRRQALFSDLIASQLIPLQERVDRLTITPIVDASSATIALLVESPEPLPLSRDVRVAAKKLPFILFADAAIIDPNHPPVLQEQPVPVTLLSNGAETAALIVPDGTTFDNGGLALDFTLARNRWRADAPTPDSVYSGMQRIMMTL
jgi:hypothetical protein